MKIWSELSLHGNPISSFDFESYRPSHYKDDFSQKTPVSPGTEKDWETPS